MEICWDNWRPPRGFTYIYALVNKRLGTVVYVGQTRQGLRDRLHAHWGEPQDWHITKQWEIAKLQMVPSRVADSAELHWVWEMRRRGHVLKNKRLPWVDSDFDPDLQRPLFDLTDF